MNELPNPTFAGSPVWLPGGAHHPVQPNFASDRHACCRKHFSAGKK
jgi:hypothetical protein